MPSTSKWVSRITKSVDVDETSKATAIMRGQIVAVLGSWRDDDKEKDFVSPQADIYAFGGIVRRELIAKNVMAKNELLQQKLQDFNQDDFKFDFDADGMALHKDTFVPSATDIDLHMDCEKQDKTYLLQTMVGYLERHIPEFKITLKKQSANYCYDRIIVTTHKHPMAHVLSVQLDIVLGHDISLLPDFTTNQLSVNLRTGELNLFGQMQWWTNFNALHDVFDLERCGGLSSLLSGGRDLKLKAKTAILADINDKISRVLLLSFKSWKEHSLKLDEHVSVRAYLAYVFRIIQYRQSKLTDDGFVLKNFKQEVFNGGFVCDHEGFIQKIDDDIILMTVADHYDGRIMQHMDDGKFLAIDYSEEDGGAEEGEEDSEDDEEGYEFDDGDIRTVYACNGCNGFHDIVKHLL
jgi:hypothetical protein